MTDAAVQPDFSALPEPLAAAGARAWEAIAERAGAPIALPSEEQVARELGVRYMLEGSVRREGDQVRINAQLIDATTGAPPVPVPPPIPAVTKTMS